MVPQRQLAYDTLVLAVGSETNDFNTYGADKHCLFLDSRLQAERFHTQLLNQYLRANAIIEESDDEKFKLNVAIIGAGATGVELAAELKNAGQQLTNYGLHRIKPERLNITLIEASDRVLAGLPPRISVAVRQELEHIGVTVLTGERVVEVEKSGIKLHSEKFIPAELKVWAAGIKAPDFLAKLPGLETNNINQIMVKQTLQSEQDESIFAFGDCAFCPQEGLARGVPPRAQSAHQQATLLSKSLPAYLFKNKALIPYVYRDRGSLISLAKYSAVGNLMGSLVGKSFLIEGKIAKIMYISLYRMHQMALYGLVKTGLFMLNDLIR